MIFEGSDGSFGGIGAMFFGRHTLKVNIIFGKGILEFLTAFVVKNVQVGCMALLNKLFVYCLPGIVNTGGLTIGNGYRMNCVGVVMLKHKNIIVASTGRNREAAGLIGIRLHDLRFFEEH